MRLLFAGMCLLAAFAVGAQPCPAGPLPAGCPTTAVGANSARLCWEHDGKATDGSTISLTGFKAYYGLNGAQTSFQSVSGGTARSSLLTGLTPGLYTFSVSALAGSMEGAKSCTTTKLVAGLPPNPPAVPQPLSIAGPVFAVQTTDNSLVVPQIGTVVAGRACDPTQMIALNGVAYMRIPLASVTLLPGMASAGLAVFGACQ